MTLNIDLAILQTDAESASKLSSFKRSLDEIGQKHHVYFSQRQHRYLIKPDLLRYHYVIAQENGTVTFDFLEHSDLDERIKAECFALYASTYKETK